MSTFDRKPHLVTLRWTVS